ncbi:hypothetical protein [Chryseobacterium sp. JUb7]|uniref:hypothetical protein n=1 Tax=Chryseobacterium sp. JUb7 TaxID=2940599 RepID=UPI002169E4DF|nr:hypothetical protein [Chryseobacterium sp. JUb7]MCS3529627.1 hypothetical protein [Chryseobacterium sp. JUb7]
MDHDFYIKEFIEACNSISQKELDNLGLRLSVQTILESVALKVYKPEWSDNPLSPLNASGRIFFSVWINDKTIKEERLYYNIHALKLRKLKGYKIAGRDFAQSFRNSFIKHQKDWNNVSILFGPLTLMEGWINLKQDTIQNDLSGLVENFIKIAPVIDETLNLFISK